MVPSYEPNDPAAEEEARFYAWGKRRLKGFALALAVTGIVVGCAGVNAMLNPDPVHGGPCGNGDQLATLCGVPGDSWCCPADQACDTSPGRCVLVNQAPDPNTGEFTEARRNDGGAP